MLCGMQAIQNLNKIPGYRPQPYEQYIYDLY